MMILKRTGPTSRGGATREGQGKPPRTGRTGPKRFLMCCIVVIPMCLDSSYVTMPRLTVRAGQACDMGAKKNQ